MGGDDREQTIWGLTREDSKFSTIHRPYHYDYSKKINLW